MAKQLSSDIISVLGVLVFLQVVSGQGADPCVDYYELGEARRSVVHNLTAEEVPLCDVYTVNEAKWARFTQYNGQKMAEKCLGVLKCGTQAPIWMNGTHPTDNAEKTVQACMSFGEGDCCAETWDIKVKRCTTPKTTEEYFVYKLKPPSGCSAAYCVGDKPPCPRYSIWNSTLTTCVCYRDDKCPFKTIAIPVLNDKEAVEQLPGQSVVTTIEGEKIINKNIICQMTYVAISGQTVTEFPASVTTSPGTYDSYYAAKCTLPPLPTDGAAFHTSGGSTNGWKLKLSNNGGLNYSQAIVFPAIDSACHSCQNKSCLLKPSVCFIQGQCFQSGVKDVLHPCLQCDPTIATDSWMATSGSCVPNCEAGKKCNVTQEDYGTSTPPTTKPWTSTQSKSTTPSVRTTTDRISTTSFLTTKSDWEDWSVCSKPACDYGIKERKRACGTTPACSGVPRERQLCNAFNCHEIDSDFEQGVILLIEIKEEQNELMIQIVESETNIMETLVDHINNICIKNSKLCCQTDSGNTLGGRADFVTLKDASIARGYPRVFEQIAVVGVKILIYINKHADQLICGRNSGNRRELEENARLYVTREVLEEAVKSSLQEVETETGLTIQGYLLPGDHETLFPGPTTQPASMPSHVIAAIVLSLILGVIAVVIIVALVAKRYINPKVREGLKYEVDPHQNDGPPDYDKATGGEAREKPPPYDRDTTLYYYSTWDDEKADEAQAKRQTGVYDTIPDGGDEGGYVCLSPPGVAHHYAELPKII